MASRADRLPTGITRVHPHTRRTLRTAAELTACPNWVWRVRAKRRGTGDFDQLYPQKEKDTLQETLDHLQRERAIGVHDLRRDAVRAQSGVFKDDVLTYLARRASTSDYRGRAYNLAIWESWL